MGVCVCAYMCMHWESVKVTSLLTTVSCQGLPYYISLLKQPCEVGIIGLPNSIDEDIRIQKEGVT